MNTVRPLHYGLLSLALMAAPAPAAVLFSNDAPNDEIGMASRPQSNLGKLAIEAADDFAFDTATQLTGATFTGLLSTDFLSIGSISSVRVEIFRVFPFDSDTVRAINVPTRQNSPADHARWQRESGIEMRFSTSFPVQGQALNSVVNNIHPRTIPTGGEGSVVGQLIHFTTYFTTPIDLVAGHYFFVPQVKLTNGNFLWLSGPRPALSAFPAGQNDLQAWIRNEYLAYDWMRVGQDIVGGPATFNGAFSLIGAPVPEAQTWAMLAVGLAVLGLWSSRRRAMRAGHGLTQRPSSC